MLRKTLFLLLLAFVTLLAGCAQNSIRQITTNSNVKESSAVIVYGIKVEGEWNFPRFGIQLDEYSIENQSIAGNCFQFNRTKASVPSSQRSIEYFAFEVPPGYYVYSPFNGVQLHLDSQAFFAPKGSTVYVGDFIYRKNRFVVLHKDLDALKEAQGKSLPNIQGEISTAEALPVKRPMLFLCTP